MPTPVSIGVTIPYARDLARAVPPVAVRLRRDFKAILSLIKAHAILHQQTRDRDRDGRIVATLEDYAAVRELVLDLASEGVGATVPASIRETVEVVAGLSDPATVKDVADLLEGRTVGRAIPAHDGAPARLHRQRGGQARSAGAVQPRRPDARGAGVVAAARGSRGVNFTPLPFSHPC